MKTILGNQFINHLNAIKKNVNGFRPVDIPADVPHESTQAECFDLIDKKDPNITSMGAGSVTYHNPEKVEVNVINYENFLNSLPEYISKGLKRPDFIAYDSDSDSNFFIINELSQGKPANKRSDAKTQMHSALKLLMEIDESREFIRKRSHKLCVFSCRSQFPDTPENIADAFGLNAKKLPAKTPIKFQPITKVGFEAFESDIINLNFD